MCAIAGIISYKKNPDDIRSMILAMGEGGADAYNFWSDNNCELAHRRLKITGFSDDANQPLLSHCKRYVMTYNGKIYNLKEIREELGISVRTGSETEVILEAFVKWGHDFVHKLNGMFAIAIWDIHSRKLHIFRDRIGIKPLYYYISSDFFAFASELKALLKNSFIRREVETDMQALGHYLHLGFIPEPYSIYKGIRKFPKGSYGLLSENELKINTYWKAEDKIQSEVITNEKSAFEQLNYLLTDSIDKHLICDVPVGIFLSGGIDSSIVAAIAKSLLNIPLNTFSIGFKEEKFNESMFASRVANHLGTLHHEYILEEADALHLLTELNDIFDEPYADSSAIPVMLLSKNASQYMKVILSGEGGDELFMGYGAYKWSKRLNNPLLKNMRKYVYYMLNAGSSRMKRASWLFDYNKNSCIQSHIFSQEQYLFSEKEVRNIFNPEYNSNDLLNNINFKSDRELTPAECQSLFDLTCYLPDDLLVKADRVCMKYFLETRMPLLDYHIVEFALNLSPELKYRNGITKYLLKKILFRYLPEEYFARPKWGFGIPLSKWMRLSMREYIEDYLHTQKLQSVLRIKTDEIPAVKKWKKGDDLYYNRVWQLAALGRWLLKE